MRNMFLKYMTWICGPQLLVLFVEIIVPLRGRVLMEEISHGWWAFCVYGFTLLPSLFVSLCLSVSACLSTLPLSFLPLCFLYGSEMWFQFSGPTPKPCVLLSNRLWLYWTISQNKYFFPLVTSGHGVLSKQPIQKIITRKQSFCSFQRFQRGAKMRSLLWATEVEVFGVVFCQRIWLSSAHILVS